MAQLKEMSPEELKEELSTIKKQLFDLKNKRSVERQLDKPHLLLHYKKQIARIKTYLTQKG